MPGPVPTDVVTLAVAPSPRTSCSVGAVLLAATLAGCLRIAVTAPRGLAAGRVAVHVGAARVPGRASRAAVTRSHGSCSRRNGCSSSPASWQARSVGRFVREHRPSLDRCRRRAADLRRMFACGATQARERRPAAPRRQWRHRGRQPQRRPVAVHRARPRSRPATRVVGTGLGARITRRAVSQSQVPEAPSSSSRHMHELWPAVGEAECVAGPNLTGEDPLWAPFIGRCRRRRG